MELVKHETCQQYVARRLSEGWRIISQSGFNVILQSPEGISRPVDLRNDVETLRPNAAGDLTEWVPIDGADNWANVDEVTADEDTTYNRGTGGLPSTAYFHIGIKENNVTTSLQKGATISWVTYSQQWNTRPSDSKAWTWADIDALQIGYFHEESFWGDLFNLPPYRAVNTLD